MVFQQMAKEALKAIYQRGHIPIVAGGTGFYIQALLNDINFTPTPSDPEYRKSLEDMAAAGGSGDLYEALRRIDPDSAGAIHPNNVKRVIRALEYYHLTKEPISHHNAVQKQKTSPYNSAFFVLTWDRSLLYERINMRVDEMIRQGLEQEVRDLLKAGYSPELTSMQGLGYKELIPFIQGKCTLDEACTLLKTRTRHFAKRQLTWFRAVPEVIWLLREPDTSMEELLDRAADILMRKGIIGNEVAV